MKKNLKDHAVNPEKTENSREKLPVTEIEIENIIEPGYSIRSTYDTPSYRHLAQNIKEVGLLNPIIVRELDTDAYEIISGNRRLMIYKDMDKYTIPAYVYKDLDDRQALILGISENLNRDDLNAFDEVYALLRLMCMTLDKSEEEVREILNRIHNYYYEKTKILSFADQESAKEIETILEKFGKLKLTFFLKKLKVLSVHKILIDAIRYQGLHYTFALELNKIKDEKKMKDLLTHVINHNLKKKEVQEEVRKALGIETKPNPFQDINTNIKVFHQLPEDKKNSIKQKIKEIEALMGIKISWLAA